MDNEVENSTESLLTQQDNAQTLEQDKHRKQLLEFYIEQLTLLFYPLILTFALTCWIEMTLNIDSFQVSNPLMIYDELPSDSIGTRLEISIINAVAVVIGITFMTFMFVFCFKFGLYKFLFFWLGLSVLSILGVTATALWIEIMDVLRFPLDYLTMFICSWNLSLVGLVAIFWNSPLWLQQGYLIIISAITSISLLRMPPWTTWAVLIVVSLYDLFAVLSPVGPLKLLINIAEERQENIPALVYTAGMADFNNTSNNPIGGYTTRESNKVNSKWSWFSLFSKDPTSKGYQTIQNEEDLGSFQNIHLQSNELSEIPTDLPSQPSTSYNTHQNNDEDDDNDDDDDDEFNAIKLGLGDFIFYSVLVGKASRTDSVTLTLCIIALLTGLAITIFILTLNRRALPALPISILFGCITYAVSYYMTAPMMNTFSLDIVMF